MRAIFIILLLISCSKKKDYVSGYLLNSKGESVSWKQLPIVLTIHSSWPQDKLHLIYEAAAIWEQGAGRKLFKINPEPLYENLHPRQDRNNVLYYYIDSWPKLPREQAVTFPYIEGDAVIESDIIFNDNKLGDNFKSVIIHELGHVLGLDHKDYVHSVMNRTIRLNDKREELYKTDTASIQEYYR
jgi:hypothetical protein